MIDTDKYEGHLLVDGEWIKHVMSQEENDATKALIKDAPLLLEEVKRLRLVIKNVAGFPKRCSPELKLGGVIDAMVCMFREVIE